MYTGCRGMCRRYIPHHPLLLVVFSPKAALMPSGEEQDSSRLRVPNPHQELITPFRFL